MRAKLAFRRFINLAGGDRSDRSPWKGALKRRFTFPLKQREPVILVSLSLR